MLAIAYASGHSIDEITAQARPRDSRIFGNWKFSWMGLASIKGLEHYPGISRREHVEELKIPLAIAATDLGTGEPVISRTARWVLRSAPPARIPECLCP